MESVDPAVRAQWDAIVKARDSQVSAPDVELDEVEAELYRHRAQQNRWPAHIEDPRHDASAWREVAWHPLPWNPKAASRQNDGGSIVNGSGNDGEKTGTLEITGLSSEYFVERLRSLQAMGPAYWSSAEDSWLEHMERELAVDRQQSERLRVIESMQATKRDYESEEKELKELEEELRADARQLMTLKAMQAGQQEIEARAECPVTVDAQP
eukprot:gnl/TRDRNA2_/TRDRNA2_194503_c0_seq1.p1 gnl/TRDRNA2_/TRDRNA2_194503_c0~~gnl/TRDRNA2_/TRDRNA2_194503_c0_seq1.p1  ORF type:complete len:211 (-),score=51.53 gnl/TRDRNA2_/TRDRNA2_194503_c0_seq1:33-665(-)